MADEFTEIITKEFGQQLYTESKAPINILIINSKGRQLAHLFENDEGLLDIQADPDDFTEAAEQFLNWLMRVWDSNINRSE